MALAAVSNSLYNFGVASWGAAKATWSVATAVAAAGASVFSRPQPSMNDDHSDYNKGRFFVRIGDDDVKEREVGFFDEKDGVMNYVHESCRGDAQKIPVKPIIVGDDVIEVAAIFLRDLQSLKTDAQQLFIGDERIVWPAADFDRDIMNQQTVQKLVEHIGSDASVLLKTTALASQNASIMLRQRVEGEFRKHIRLPADYIPKFVPGHFNVTTRIVKDGHMPRIICELAGDISSIERPAKSMDELAIVKDIEKVTYHAEASFDPFNQEVEYSVDFE